jgi:hypothetical protein
VENLPDTELQPFQNIDMALGRLLSGELDAFIFPEPIMQHKLRLMRISDRVKAAGPPWNANALSCFPGKIKLCSI